MAAKKKTVRKSPETSLRHVWLAALGLVVVARRETRNAANEAVARVQSFTRQAGKLAGETQANVLDGLASVRQQGEARVGQFSADAESRLAPVLVKLGLKPKPAANKRGRKPAREVAAKRAPARKQLRKPAAKRAVKRARR